MSQLKRIQITQEQKKLLEEISGVSIKLRNNFEENKSEISGLQEQAKQNAIVYLERQSLGQRLSTFEENNLFKTVVELEKKLNLKHLPRRIECYDISHLSGKFVYGSMVVFIDGKPMKSLYKLFKTKEQNNDFENHKEVLFRRFRRCLKWIEDHPDKDPKESPWRLPELIIVDGGKGQLSSDIQVLERAKEIFKTANVPFEVELCALAKKEEEIFLPNTDKSVILEGSAKFLVQRIRDEAHRFAITNNRKARLKTAHQSKLDKIPGLGPKTKDKLLKSFGSVANLIENLIDNRELVEELVGAKMTETLKQELLK